MAHAYNAPACPPQLQLPSACDCISAAQPPAWTIGLLVKERGADYRCVMTAIREALSRTGAHRDGEGRPQGYAIEQPQAEPDGSAAFLDMRPSIWLTRGVNL